MSLEDDLMRQRVRTGTRDRSAGLQAVRPPVRFHPHDSPDSGRLRRQDRRGTRPRTCACASPGASRRCGGWARRASRTCRRTANGCRSTSARTPFPKPTTSSTNCSTSATSSACEGYLFRTRTGELSVHAEKLHFLSKTLLTMPEKWHGLEDVETRYRQRYLDLIANPRRAEGLRHARAASSPPCGGNSKRAASSKWRRP